MLHSLFFSYGLLFGFFVLLLMVALGLRDCILRNRGYLMLIMSHLYSCNLIFWRGSYYRAFQVLLGLFCLIRWMRWYWQLGCIRINLLGLSNIILWLDRKWVWYMLFVNFVGYCTCFSIGRAFCMALMYDVWRWRYRWSLLHH